MFMPVGKKSSKSMCDVHLDELSPGLAAYILPDPTEGDMNW